MTAHNESLMQELQAAFDRMGQVEQLEHKTLAYMSYDRPLQWYVATPFTNYPGGHQEAWKIAVRITGALAKTGFIVYSPIVHWYPVAKAAHIDGAFSDYWRKVNSVSMGASFAAVVPMIPGYDTSNGVKDECAWFSARGRPVVYLPTPNEFLQMDSAGASPAIPESKAVTAR